MAEFLKNSSQQLQENFLAAFGTGVLYFMGIPVLIILLTVLLFTIPFAIVLCCLYTITLIFARPATAIILAHVLQRRSGKTWSSGRQLLTSFGIYLLIVMISYLPFIGWPVACIIVGASVGSALQVVWAKRKSG
jgi:hypothetical protein